jgi:hypothetical protein
MLRVACDKCGRSGQYRVDKLVQTNGPDARLTDWLHAITADCPRKIADNYRDQCAANMPDLRALAQRSLRK